MIFQKVDPYANALNPNAKKSILHQIDLMLPHGDTIGVSVRKAYFGEVMAKDDLADCFKLTVEDSGKRSYEPFKREIDK